MPRAYWTSSATAMPKAGPADGLVAAGSRPASGLGRGLRATGIPDVPAVSRTVIHHFRQQDDFRIYIVSSRDDYGSQVFS